MSQSPAKPPVRIGFEPRFCSNHVVDLTAGCSFGCIYCPFSDIEARRLGMDRPTALDMSPLPSLPAPPTVFLSPSSDPFTPQAAPSAHDLLRQLLPRGTVVGILTKGVIPERTLDLLASYPDQVEGVVVGVTSLDDARNRVLEPGCPPVRERLGNIERAARRSLPVALRMDPLFPLLDDAPQAMAALLDEAAARGAGGITATYVFAWGRYLRRLRREPLLAESCTLLSEKAPMEGGTAFSVSLSRKLDTYAQLAELARARGMLFNTCGCKDLRVRDAGIVSAACRHSSFLAARFGTTTPCATPRAPDAAAPSAQPSAPRA